MKGLLIYFDVIDGKQKEFEAATRVLVSRVRERDPSYSLYSLARLRDTPTRYVLVQRFDSYEAQLAHQGYDYVLECMPPMQPFFAGPPSIQFLDIVD
jgi:quinol monooxygenase YgiN